MVRVSRVRVAYGCVGFRFFRVRVLLRSGWLGFFMVL